MSTKAKSKKHIIIRFVTEKNKEGKTSITKEFIIKGYAEYLILAVAFFTFLIYYYFLM
jgi:hypothetical protein